MADDDTPFYPSAPSAKKAPAVPINRPRRQRKSTIKASEQDSDDDFAGPRQSTVRLKVSKGSDIPVGPGGETRIGWDRELDSDGDVPLAVEEQFILRVPAKLAPSLHEQVSSKSIGSDVWFKFLDSRRAVYHQGEQLYGAKLVDLPTLSESQRLTGNGGQTIKVADIHQMLIVEDEVAAEQEVVAEGGFNIEDFIYPHGLTPPLKHVRKRRFRKRVDNRTVEVVEAAVERLLEADKDAEQVKFEVLDYEVPSDEETGGARAVAGGSPDESFGVPTPREAGDASSVRGEEDDEGQEGEEDEEDEEEDESDEDGFDEALLAEINNQMGNGGAPAQATDDDDDDDEDESADEGGLFGSDDDDEEVVNEEDDAETAEQKKRIKLLQSEVNDLDRAIAAKEVDLGKQSNPIFKKRFEDMIKKLSSDREAKRAQHAAAVRELEKKVQKATEQSAQPPAPAAAAPTDAPPSAPTSGALPTALAVAAPAGLNIVPPSPVVGQQAKVTQTELPAMQVDTPADDDAMDQD